MGAEAQAAIDRRQGRDSCELHHTPRAAALRQSFPVAESCSGGHTPLACTLEVPHAAARPQHLAAGERDRTRILPPARDTRRAAAPSIITSPSAPAPPPRER